MPQRGFLHCIFFGVRQIRNTNMRIQTTVFISAMLVFASVKAADITSFAETLISNPPKPPKNCKTLSDGNTLERDDSGHLYYLYECRNPNGQAKYLRLWRLNVEESMPDARIVNPIRVVNEVVVYRSRGRDELGIYSCSVKGGKGLAVAILPHNDSDMLMIKNAFGIWRVSSKKLEAIQPDQLGACLILRG
jgi:hypothetical protein